MSGQVNPSVLQRMVGSSGAAPAEVPVSASRAMRLAVTRAAERSVGLQLTVIGVGEESLMLDGVQTSLNDEMLLLKLSDADGFVGVLAVDRGFVGAVVEVQTTGQISAVAPEMRPVTFADLMLVKPFLDGLFDQLLETTQRTGLEGWTDGITHGARFDDVRAIGLALAHVQYRLMRISVDLGGGERQGEVILALPAGDAVETSEPVAAQQVDWAKDMRETVMESPAALSAVLHRFELPLYIANALEVNQVLPLPGCTVSSVQLVGPDGARVARAKLGQVNGHIAVRLEDPMAPQMKELKPVADLPDAQLVLADKAG